MNIISWTRLCYVLLAGSELEEFLLDLAVKSAAASRCDKSRVFCTDELVALG